MKSLIDQVDDLQKEYDNGNHIDLLSALRILHYKIYNLPSSCLDYELGKLIYSTLKYLGFNNCMQDFNYKKDHPEYELFFSTIRILVKYSAFL